MKKTVWKYKVHRATDQAVPMPAGAELLRVDFQDGMMQIWALVDPEAEIVGRRILILGTGHVVEWQDYTYVGTTFQGPFVWHVFDAGEA